MIILRSFHNISEVQCAPLPVICIGIHSRKSRRWWGLRPCLCESLGPYWYFGSSSNCHILYWHTHEGLQTQQATSRMKLQAWITWWIGFKWFDEWVKVSAPYFPVDIGFHGQMPPDLRDRDSDFRQESWFTATPRMNLISIPLACINSHFSDACRLPNGSWDSNMTMENCSGGQILKGTGVWGHIVLQVSCSLMHMRTASSSNW